MLRQALGVLSGMLCWLVLMAATVLPGGAGHGWMGPFAVSWPGILLLPLTGLLLATPGRHGPILVVNAPHRSSRRRTTAVVLFGILILLDVAIVAITASHIYSGQSPWNSLDGPFVLAFSLPWLALWLIWHVILIRIIDEKM